MNKSNVATVAAARMNIVHILTEQGINPTPVAILQQTEGTIAWLKGGPQTPANVAALKGYQALVKVLKTEVAAK